MLSIILDQDSFMLQRQDPETCCRGVIELSSSVGLFLPPSWTQMRLVGKEQIDDKVQVIVDDTYHLSSRPDDWQMISNNNSYQLEFSLTVPSNIPSSFEDENALPNRSICYTIQLRTSLAPETCWIRPIYFHQSIAEEPLPKRVFWGVAKSANNQLKWQYEIEFPNMFHLDITKSEYVFVRMRSLGASRPDTCCLIGCQIIQVIQMEGYKCQNQIVAATAKLLRTPNTSWNQPFQLTCKPSQPVMPTVEGHQLTIDHYIKFTFAFSDSAVESNISFEFPIQFVGNLYKNSAHTTISTKYQTPTLMSSSPSSFSSSASMKEETQSHDSALDLTAFSGINTLPFFYKE